MSDIVKDKVIELLTPKLLELGLTEEDVNVSESLLSQGILDSMSFLEFTLELETAFNIEIDFSELDPSEFTSIENILKFIKDGNKN